MAKKSSVISQFLRKNLLVIVICGSIVAGTFSILVSHYKYFRFESSVDLVYLLESKLLDVKFKLRGKEAPSDKIGVLAIDEKSLAKFGRWPISRRYYAQAFANLKKNGVRWIGFDAIFSEPEKTYLEDVMPDLTAVSRSKPAQVPQLLQNSMRNMNQLLEKSKPDQVFRVGMESFQNIIMGFFYFGSEQEAAYNLGDRPRFNGLDDMLSSEIFYDAPDGFSIEESKVLRKTFGIVSNTSFLAKSSPHFAFFSNDSDSDAINRWITLVAEVDGHLMPSLALKSAAEFLNRDIFVFFDDYGVESIAVVDRDDPSIATEIPIDPVGAGRLLINHRGPSRTFHEYSLADAYDDNFTPEQRERLQGSLLLLGATATGINDMRPNPFDPAIDGVENHAAAIDNIIRKDFMKRSGHIHNIEIGIVLTIGLLFTLVLLFSSALVSGVSLIVFLVGYYYFDHYVWFNNGVWAYMAVPSLQITFMYIVTTFYKYMTEEKEKRMVKGAFQHYLSPEVIDQVLDDPSALALGGQKKELTVFFSDVRSFTTISESLTPEKLCELMNEYFTPMTSIVLRSKGVLDKYIGDAIMAFWGAPLELENSADVGCQASIEMLYALDKIRVDFPKRGFPVIDIGIGLNTGQMSVGNMGSGERFTYTVMGDSVNLGSRLEGLTKEYGIKVMISEFTQAKLTPGKFFTRDLDDIRVKGKHEPVKVFDLMRPDFFPQQHLITEFIQAFEQGRKEYSSQSWDKAHEAFAQCLRMRPEDKAASMYLERVKEYMKHAPGEQWDGVYTFTHK
ncbi:MAG: CHASE2 domain-containing protein [Oligoflexus sp.]